MTLVGKIFVIAITFLTTCFLVLSVVVFSTSVNWKAKADDLQKKITQLSAEKKKAEDDVAQRTNELKQAEEDHKAALADLNTKIKNAEDQVAQFQRDVTDLRTKLEKSQVNATNALVDAKARVEEAVLLREQVTNIQSLTNRYKEAQLALQDQVVQLERDLNVAQNSNKDLRERAALLSAVRSELNLLKAELARPGAASPALKARTTKLASIINQGLSDPARIKILEGPPRVLQGEITEVDPKAHLVKLSIGSDDGLIPGHTMYITRKGPQPLYIGELTIRSVDPDQAVGVITRTYQGRKPEEHDVVKPTNSGR